ncbi:hypothetical protein, partial [Streptosporangium sp. NPDC023615]|uniref:hypothetical protein n=1 Tax=Streptosporangium sp. NPDC023615 TaxID=3154794 RepID=UPI00343C8925
MSILVLDDDDKRRRIVEGIASGLTMQEACAKEGVGMITVYSYRCANQEFDEAIVEASRDAGGRLVPVFWQVPPYKDQALRERIIADV